MGGGGSKQKNKNKAISPINDRVNTADNTANS